MWILIIFLVLRCLVSAEFGPHTPMRGCGGAFPSTIDARGRKLMSKPLPMGVRGKRPQKDFFFEKCLVKYCNFVVSLDHLLCHISNSRSYVNLWIFFPRRKPSIIYEGILLQLCIISKRRHCERVKRKLQRICCRLYPFGLLDYIKERTGNFSVGVAQIG